MISIVVMMAGPSQAFKDVGYFYPKNLVEIDGQPLIQRVLTKLSSSLQLKGADAKLICILPNKESLTFFTSSVIKLIEPEATIIELPGQTSGAACSSLLAVDHINNENPLLIVNGDQIIEWDLKEILESFVSRKLDAGCIVFEDIHPRWSFVKCDKDGYVIEAAEKRPISKNATAGFYYYRHGKDFVAAVMSMIKKDAKTNDLFYICPAFNELILMHKKIGVFEIPKKAYTSLAMPAQVEAYDRFLRTKGSTDQ